MHKSSFLITKARTKVPLWEPKSALLVRTSIKNYFLGAQTHKTALLGAKAYKITFLGAKTHSQNHIFLSQKSAKVPFLGAEMFSKVTS